MSQLRKDLLSGRWVIIATERSKRPDDFRPAAAPEKKDQATGFCPFCEGNETKTPPEVFALRREGTKADEPGWRVRVVPNKFPALNRAETPTKSAKGVLQWMEGVGVHEVVIENPDHDKELVDLPEEDIKNVLWIFQERIKNIETELHYQYVQIFKNKGKEAGASLSHPHSQIVATPIVPKRLKEEIYGAERLYRKWNECVFCKMIREEIQAAERLVYQDGHFAAIAPFASRFPFEIHLYPKKHSALYSSVGPEELTGLAAAVKAVLSKLKTTISDPPYNLILHQAPNITLSDHAWPGIKNHYHWHVEIIPILTRAAGFELGTGFYINPVPPETAAQFLR